MKKINPTVRLVTTGLLIAFTCITTMLIQIPTTATLGYIHIGDTFVILTGIILGPVLGGLAAGIGSLLADALSGYAIYVIPTFLIKFTAAFLCGFIYRKLRNKKGLHETLTFLFAAIIAELNIIIGYFLTNLVLTMLLNSSTSKETIVAGIWAGLLSLIPNLIQGFVGVFLSFLLFPLLKKVPSIQDFLNINSSYIKKK